MQTGYDAIVIGGGIIGCSVAWRLAQTGRKVALLERGHVGGEASSAAGGIFIPEASPDVPEQQLRLWDTSNQMYPAFVDEVRAVTGQAFEFRVSGRLEVGYSDEDVARLREHFALQGPAGIRARWLTGADALAAEPALAPDVQAAIYFPDHGLVDNPRLTHALGWAVRRAAGDVFENRLVTGLVVEQGRVAGVETLTGRVSGPIVVNCAGSWSGLIDPRSRQPVRPAKGQMLAVDPRPASLRYIVAGPGGSAVPRADGRTLIGATVHDVGYDKDVIAGDISGMFERTARILPALRQARFLDAWAGLRPLTPDRQPLIGPDPELGGLYWATGHFTMGILLAPATARAIADLIAVGRSTIPIGAFGAERFAAAAPN
jgi:glycine oxidase